MLMNKHIVMMTFGLLPNIAFAFFCPTNFNQINFGDSIEEVTKQCGRPAKEETKTAEQKVPQEWNYYIAQTIEAGGSSPMQGTLKTSVAFDKDGKAINISANGIGVGETAICGNPIQLGSTMEQVKAACGEPSFINKQQPSSAAPTPPTDADKITELTYLSNPPTVLVFEGGLLTSKK